MNNPRLEAEEFGWRRLEVDFLVSVFPANPPQGYGRISLRLKRESRFFVSPPTTTLDARLRGHDGPSLRLEVRDFNHAREGN